MLKLDIQMFGGRGASSGSNKPRGEKLNIVVGNESKRISFNSLKEGDTFQIKGRAGTYNMRIASDQTSRLKGYDTFGTNTKGGSFMTMLVTDRTYENADYISKQYMTPLSRTGNWRRS